MATEADGLRTTHEDTSFLGIIGGHSKEDGFEGLCIIMMAAFLRLFRILSDDTSEREC